MLFSEMMKSREAICAVPSADIVSLFATAFIYCFIDGVGAYFGALIFLFIPMGLFMVSHSDMRRLTKAMNLTREYETAEYVHERQDRD